jgi:hypothetical protein
MRRFAAVFLVVAVVGGPGCQQSETSVPVTGRVMMDGNPVARGRILFVKSDNDPAPLETTIVDGAFSLNLLPGGRKVLVYVYGTKKLPNIEKVIADPQSNLAPPRYNKNTELKAEVTALGPNELTFELSSQ